MYGKKGLKNWLTFRANDYQAQAITRYADYYHQSKANLLREALSLWLNRQNELHPLPNDDIPTSDNNEVGIGT